MLSLIDRQGHSQMYATPTTDGGAAIGRSRLKRMLNKHSSIVYYFTSSKTCHKIAVVFTTHEICDVV